MADPTKAATVQQVSQPLFQVRPLQNDIRYLKAVFYGPPGSGKTTLAGSAVDVAGMDDVLFVSAESGTLSVQSAEWIQNRFYIDEIPVSNFKQVAHVQEFLKAHCVHRDGNDIPKLKALQARVFGYPIEIIDETCEDDEYTEGEDGTREFTRVRLRKYRTVIVDSLSEINAYLIYQLLGIKPDTKLDDADAQDTAGWDEYKKGNQMLQMLIRAYRDLPMHVLMVCGTQYTQDEQKIMHWAPSLIGKLGVQIQGFVDVCGFMMTGKPTEGEPNKVPRKLYIQPTGRFDAKSRLANFKDASIDSPTMQKIMNAFRGVKTVSQAPAANTAKK